MALQSFTITIGALTDAGNNGKNYVNNQPVYIKQTNGTLASIYRDLAGTSQIAQDGLSNVTNSKGQFTFFIEAGDYNTEYQSQVTPITVVGADYFNSRIDETVNQIILDLSSSRGFRVQGSFAAGFTYELPNDVGVDGSGNYWVYTDVSALPFVVTAATTPSAPVYTQVTFADHNNLINRSAVGAHDDIYHRKFSLVSDVRGSGLDTQGLRVYCEQINSIYTITDNPELIDGFAPSAVALDDGFTFLNLSNGYYAVLDHVTAVDYVKTQWPKLYANAMAKLRLKKSAKVVCYGDSITFGQGTVGKADSVDRIGDPTNFGDGSTYQNWQLITPYPTQLQAYLRDVYGDVNLTVENRGYSGDSAYQLVKRHITPPNADIGVVMIGINDCAYATNNHIDEDGVFNTLGYKLADFTKALEVFLTREVMRGTALMLMSCESQASNVGFDGTVNSGNVLTEAYNDAIRSIGSKYGIPVIETIKDIFYGYPIYARVVSPGVEQAGLTHDGVHLDPYGVNVLAGRLTAVFSGKGAEFNCKYPVYSGSKMLANYAQDSVNSPTALMSTSSSSYAPFFLSQSEAQSINLTAGQTVYFSFYAANDDLIVYPCGKLSDGGVTTVTLNFGAEQPEYTLDYPTMQKVEDYGIESRPASAFTLEGSASVQEFGSRGDLRRGIHLASKGWHTIAIFCAAGTCELYGLQFSSQETAYSESKLSREVKLTGTLANSTQTDIYTSDSDYEDILVDLRCDVGGTKHWCKSRLTKVGATYAQSYELADSDIRIEWNGNNITIYNDTDRKSVV